MIDALVSGKLIKDPMLKTTPNVTPVTPKKKKVLQLQTTPHKAITPVTPVTPKI